MTNSTIVMIARVEQFEARGKKIYWHKGRLMHPKDRDCDFMWKITTFSVANFLSLSLLIYRPTVYIFF